MSPTRSDPPIPLPDTQRRVRRSRLLFMAPLVLLGILVVILLWEVVRSNMSAEARLDWPWRLRILEPDPLGSLLAVAAGAVFARAQYARTVRPYLGWRASWEQGDLRSEGAAWRVGILNGGQHTAVIESYDFRVVPAGGTEDGETSWVDAQGAGAVLTAAGLTAGEDYLLVTFGPGFPLVGTGNYETVLVGAFSKRVVDQVDALYLRVRVTDAVGDSHERIVNCLKAARVSPRPV
ncbi:hypothetical protein ACFT9I_31335 [Streptomyces sp. NPDC057137]|uniref:hypothetical protein n=1 Tax=Streptomyces sp. NPDC057137 TaxID=3346030 RepID=UPI003636CE45